MRCVLPALVMLAATAAACAGDGPFTLSEPKLSFRSDWQPSDLQPEPQPVPTADLPPQPPHGPRFGEENSQWLTMGLGVATVFGDATDINLRFAWSQFLIDDVEFSFEGNLWYSDQRGTNAIGFNPAMIFRWHWVSTPRWSFYGDVGIGLMFSDNPMPSGGTRLNFTPRAGIGWTYQISEESDTRLQIGLRWHHLSNARITGDDHNPARDLPMLYAAIVIPF